MIELPVWVTRHPRHSHAPRDVVKVLAEVDPVYGDVGPPLPGPVLGAEPGHLGVGTGLVPVQPGDVVTRPALVLHLASLRRLNMEKYSREPQKYFLD